MAGNEEAGPMTGWTCDECARRAGKVLRQAVNGAHDGVCPKCGNNGRLLPERDWVDMPVLAASVDSKTRFYPGHANAFGILPGPEEVGGTCPWATTGCGGCFNVPEGRKNPTCYAYALMKAYTSCRRRIQENTDALKGLVCVDDMASALDAMLSRFEKLTRAYMARNDGVGNALSFRWHWAGDLFSREYARALSLAMWRHPDVRFWSYTRSFNFAHEFAAPNLNLYYSLDDDNWEQGLSWYLRWGDHNRPNRRIAYMAKSVESVRRMVRAAEENPGKYLPGDPGSVARWAASVRIQSCPVDLGGMPTDGACVKCMQCIAGGSQLLFFKC